ncbi:hypothetical protein ACP4OV_018144 [Aristida adscensionis]
METAFKDRAGGEAEGTVVAVGKGDEGTMTDGDVVFPANFAELVASLPQERAYIVFPYCRLYRGFWLPEARLLSLPQVHAHFHLGPSDVLLASVPKSGTTWLKALCFATARRSLHSPFDAAAHPLLRTNSHDCVKSMDLLRFLDAYDSESPRIVSTHLPYSLLPSRAMADDGGCRIVHVSRDPKDTLVSTWHFAGKAVHTGSGDGVQAPPPLAFEEAFELYCQGRYGIGPSWEHAREYWEASKRRPEHVLCLRYEEMLRDPAGSVRRMAAFIGCPFSEAEEEAGTRWTPSSSCAPSTDSRARR